MDYKKLLSRVAAVGAAVSVPVIASAAIGDEDNSAGTGVANQVSATITLAAELESVIRMRIYERNASQANPNGGSLDTPSYVTSSGFFTGTLIPAAGITTGTAGQTTLARTESVNFGLVTTNPTSNFVTDAGYHLDLNEGAVFVAQLWADLYFTGATTGYIDIEGDDPTGIILPTGASRLNPNNTVTPGDADYWAAWDCMGTSPTAETTYSASGVLNDADLTDGNPLSAPFRTNCATFATGTGSGPGVINHEAVDLLLYLGDTAPTGDYGEDFVFYAYVDNN